MRQFARASLSRAKAPDNVRHSLGTDEELRALGHSCKKRPVHPLIAHTGMPLEKFLKAEFSFIVLDGWRRVNGLRLIGETDAEFLFTDEHLEPDAIVQIGLLTAIHRQALSDPEIYRGCKKLQELHPGWLQKDLAAATDLSPSKVTKILSVDDLIAEAREAFLAGNFGFSVAYPISLLPPEQQAAALTAKLNGATRDDLLRRAKQASHGGKPTVKTARIRIELPTGVIVTFAAKDDSLDLDHAIEAAAQAGRLLKKGQDEGLTAKTIQKVSVERARAGN